MLHVYIRVETQTPLERASAAVVLHAVTSEQDKLATVAIQGKFKADFPVGPVQEATHVFRRVKAIQRVIHAAFIGPIGVGLTAHSFT